MYILRHETDGGWDEKGSDDENSERCLGTVRIGNHAAGTRAPADRSNSCAVTMLLSKIISLFGKYKYYKLMSILCYIQLHI